jgi:hypothetical protein
MAPRKKRRPPPPPEAPTPVTPSAAPDPPANIPTLTEYLEKHGAIDLICLPELEEQGIPLGGIGSKPGELSHALALYSLGREVEARRRRPGKRNTDRDAEIVRLRDADPKKWSWGRLGLHFHISRDAARKAYKHYKRDNAPRS